MLQEIWGWQPALYLFLGGMGAGAFVAAAMLYLKNGQKNGKIICISMWAALASLAIGLLLLLSELVFPLRGLMMWQSFSQFGSWMTLGAWGAFLAMAVFFVSAVLAIPRKGKAAGDAKAAVADGEAPAAGEADGAKPAAAPVAGEAKTLTLVRRILAAAGIVLGLFVAFYTGMLLYSAPGVPLWNTMLLPCLFTVSGLDTGIALVEVVSLAAGRSEETKLDESAHSLLSKCVVALVVLEVVVLAAFLATQSGAAAQGMAGSIAAMSATTLISGDLAGLFWGLVVVCGLGLPLVAAVLGLRKQKQSAIVLGVGALGALAGGCALRFLVLGAGAHADIVLATMQSVIGG